MPTQPLAVAVLAVGAESCIERRRARIAVGAFAHAAGFVLLETFELGVNAVRDEIAVRSLVAVTYLHDVSTVLTSGDVDESALLRLDLRETLEFVAVDGEPDPVRER